MTFAHPSYIAVAVIAAAAFLAFYRWIEARRHAHVLQYSNLAFLIGAARPRSWIPRVLSGALVLAVALVVLALAGPRVRAAVPIAGSFVLCIDTSGSMSARDVEPTRAQAAVAAMRAFIDRTPNSTAIGLISFATGAQSIISPTRDRDQLHAVLQAIPPPNGSTAIGDALSLAQRILPKSGHRIVVLITDGENNYGEDPMAAAQALAMQHIPIYTIGIGSNSGALIPGSLETAGINEGALRAYAAVTGAAYSRADDAVQLREALAQLGQSTTLRPAIVDVSLATAVAGGALMALTILAGLAAGRFP
ncbi:MAG: vWA domain-containing protein [Vulcanimicrobiaceae bacterium]